MTHWQFHSICHSRLKSQVRPQAYFCFVPNTCCRYSLNRPSAQDRRTWVSIPRSCFFVFANTPLQIQCPHSIHPLDQKTYHVTESKDLGLAPRPCFLFCQHVCRCSALTSDPSGNSSSALWIESHILSSDQRVIERQPSLHRIERHHLPEIEG